MIRQQPSAAWRTTGCPSPTTSFGEAHPTISGPDPRPHQPRRDHAQAEHRAAARATRSSSPTARASSADLVVYCTGYKITFPFFDEDFIAAPDNHIELFRRVFHPDIDDVVFVGLLQPLGAIMPLAEAQGQWIADLPQGRVPPAAAAGAAARHPRATRTRCASATSPPSATRSRSTSTTTSATRQASARPGAERARAARLRAAGRAARGGAARTGREVAARRAPLSGKREAHQAGQPRGDPRRGARGLRRHRLRRGERARHRPAHRPRDRDVLQLLPRQGGGAPRARSTRSRREVRARVRAARAPGGDARGVRRATASAPTSRSSPRTRRRLELMRRNAGTIRALFDEPALGAGHRRAAEDLDAGIAAGLVPAHDTGSWRRRWSAPAFEVGLEMVAREPIDVERLGRGRHLHLRGRVPAHAVGMGRATAKLRAS